MYIAYTVKRTQIYLDEEQDARLGQRATAAGTTKSALIRQAITDFLSGPDADVVALGRFRAALDEIEAQPIPLPDGAAYTESVRARELLRQADLQARLALERPSGYIHRH